MDVLRKTDSKKLLQLRKAAYSYHLILINYFISNIGDKAKRKMSVKKYILFFTITIIKIHGITHIPNMQSRENNLYQKDATRTENIRYILPGKLNQSAPSGGHMFEIEQAGEYALIDNLTLSPPNTNVNGITISASNVTLDLAGCTIIQDNTSSGLVAINIAANVSHITIKNGTINTIYGTGIRAQNNCSLLEIKDLIIRNCNVMGMYLTNVNQAILTNLTIINCNGTAANDAIGLGMLTSKNITTSCSQFNNNRNTNGRPGHGIYLYACSNCLFEFCEASTNYGTTAYGFRIDSVSSNCTVLNCHAKANEATTISYGFYVNGRYNILKNCVSTNQMTSGANFSYGFYTAGGQGNQHLSCSAYGNTGGTGGGVGGVGFGINGNEKYSSMKQCISNANFGNTGASGNGIGILIFSGSQNCSFDQNQLVNNKGPSSGYGILDLNTLSTNVFTRNFAYGNGNSAGTTFNNYVVNPAPSGSLPVLLGNLNNYATFSSYYGLDLYNIEIRA
ncbi:MAG: hypothetical protein US13_C0011G0012 [candidate division TM6 bacterium GW2011_GWE2_36_25]|nr:MAG: hypothetical protein US03_C0007G0024 [candidate division TM6 bacterium GW2011_GWF2_36_131]KKQ02704.1 MAG: hypothetical protein US13_C0011G0012 [candidate division TM6 bacterium GW2011_GWE2_36_25]KKQ19591.1 MAG: hypothetical protein US32_C0007G0044 [candidate division TM6 bacterium GW2011_GWA2_36_9]